MSDGLLKQLEEGTAVMHEAAATITQLRADLATAEQAAAEATARAEKDHLVIRDLTMIVNRLSKYAPDDKVAKVFDYLHRKNLASPLRATAAEANAAALAATVARMREAGQRVVDTHSDGAGPAARIAALYALNAALAPAPAAVPEKGE